MLKSTKLMENGNIQDAIDMQKKLQMTKEFKELEDEEDRQESEALKAQMELDIAQAQIQRKQLQQKKALLKAHTASIMKQQQLHEVSKKQQLEALRATHNQQQLVVKKREKAQQLALRQE